MAIKLPCAAVFACLGALLLAVLGPMEAAAHAGHAHAPQQSVSSPAVGRYAVEDKARNAVRPAPVAATAELRMFVPASIDDPIAGGCGDRGCCSAGHCSGCGTALAPSSWADDLLSEGRLLSIRNIASPSGLAREGPPRPPKSFV